MRNITELMESLREVGPGGGLVTPFVNVSRRATIDKDSQATGSAEIFGDAKILEGSVVRDFAKAMEYCEVRGSILQSHARVGGAAIVEQCIVTGTAEIRGVARVRDSQVFDNAMVQEHAEVYKSELGGNVRVMGEAKLWNVVTGGPNNTASTYLIEGDAVLNFPSKMRLRAGTRVHEGVWTRPPMVIDTPVFLMVEGINDRVQIGCLNHSIPYWYKHGKKELLKYGLPEELYEKFLKALDKMVAYKSKFKSPYVRRKKK